MDNISRYNIGKKEIRVINLEETHMQYIPKSHMLYTLCLTDGKLDTNMLNSPHYKIAKLYFSKGEKWLRDNYKSTDYFRMWNDFSFSKKKDPIKKIINVCKSIEKGYLRKGYEKEYPTVLEKPFAFTRYNVEAPMVKYEVFTGHHRIGVLLALGVIKGEVIIGEDLKPSSCYSEGKIHNLCIGNLKK